MSANGTAVAVWTWNNGTHTIVQDAVRPPGGAFPTAGTAPTLSDTAQNADTAKVAMNDRGDAAVVWLRSNATNEIAQARVRPAGGAFAPTVDLSSAGADAGAPDVAIDPLGRATAVWTRSNLVESRFLTAAGALDGGIDNVSDTAESVSAPTVALDANNNAVAVWTGGTLTKAASRPSRGSFGAPQTISSPGDSNALPLVAMDPAGNAFAVWTQSLTTIQAARRPPNGTFGGVEDVSRPPGQGVIPSLAADGEGNAIVGWTQLANGQETAQVTAFDAAPPTLGAVNVPATGTVGQAVPMSAAASDRWSGANLTWAFGDGATGTGGSPVHTYGAPCVCTVTVTAADAAGNSTTAQRTIQVANPPAPPAPPVVVAGPKPTPRLSFTLAFKYRAGKKSTTLTSLVVQGVPTGSTITVSCTPPGKHARCPAKAFRKAKAHGTIKLSSFLHKAFKRGTVIEVRVTRAGAIGAVKRLIIRSTNGPSTTTRCLKPGATKPSTRC
jgi:hypothetical protein